MKKLYFIFFFLIISCSGNNKKELVDLEAFVNEGKKIETLDNLDFLSKEVFLIKKVSKDKNILNFKLTKNFENYKIKKTIHENFLIFEKIQNYYFGIDSQSYLILMDHEFKILKKKKLYKKKIIKNYNLNFSTKYIAPNIIIADNLGNIRSIKIPTLDIVWSSNYSVPFKSNFVKYNKNLIIINSNSKLYSISSTDGKINWSVGTAKKNITNDSFFKIINSNDKLLFLNDFGQLFCVDLKINQIIWTINLETKIYNNSPTFFKSTKLITKNNILYFSSNFGFTYAININSGNVIWSQNVFSDGNIFLDSKYIFFTNKKNLLILNKSDGKLLFNFNIGNILRKKITFFEDILVSDTFIYLFANNGKIIRINKNNLKEVKEFKKNTSFRRYDFIGEFFALFANKSLILF